ncbi:septation protein A [Lacimicrobium alkaliphilum]|uniref:Inner membrane-spanning protein YciB n=1 Tax=Lacimicrobium alkaliphilum TaxID=1526571 RepID=A0ABQ1R3K5_9ALTE|nr:septation protein A [Lacimicrobium alkaliphilum]GGD54872.1 putative intracellular septation protein A [Lacimicrobium alkaliphilum]
MQFLLEFLPLLIFFVVYKMQDIFWATGALMLATLLQILVTYLQTKEVPKKQWVFLIMILVFGGLTIGLRDEHFIMWKPSIVYVLFAVILLGSQLMKRPALKSLLGSAMVLPDKIWKRLNISWAAFFLASAAANLYVAYGFSESIWVNFKVFGMTGVTLIFTIATIMYAYKYMPEEQTDSANDEK